MNQGLAAVEFYSLSTGQADEQQIILGAQDAGLFYYNAGNWFGFKSFGDGTGTFSSHGAQEVRGGSIGFSTYGEPYHYLPGTEPQECGSGSPIIGSEGFPAGFDSEYIQDYTRDPILPENIWAAVGQGVAGNMAHILTYRTGQGPWVNSIPGPNMGGLATLLEVGKTPSNSRVFYCGYIASRPCSTCPIGKQLFRSMDDGAHWTDITPALGPYHNLNDIAIDPNEPNKIWAVFSGGLKVRYSNDYGNTWTTLDGGLPDVPIYSVVVDPRNGSADDAVYLGTDWGTYYTDNTRGQWECYNSNFKYVLVHDLEIAENCGMIRAATFGRGLWESPLHPLPGQIYYSDGFEVNANTIWTQDVYLDNDIIVKQGNTLTIKGTVFMPSFGKISVERGAQLIVDGGRITSRGLCVPSSIWRGIFVEGNPNQPQTTNYQGKVSLINGAVIEDAVTAVSTSRLRADGSPDWAYTGGIIQASNSIFRNNVRAVEFLSYHNRFASLSETPNVSFFRSCTFETTGPLKEFRREPTTFVSMFDVYGVRFRDNLFINRSQSSFPQGASGHGIYAIEADFTASGMCSQNSSGACLSWTGGNRFENMVTGIFSTTIQRSARFTKIEGNSFKNCQQAVVLEATDFDVVEGNEIEVDANAHPVIGTFTGIYALKCGSYKIRNNHINISPAGVLKTYAIITNATGVSTPGQVTSNKLEGAAYGYQAELHNRKVLLNCNDFSNIASTDFRTIPYPGSQFTFLPHQGSATPSQGYPSGYDPNNLFDVGCTPGSLEHIQNLSTVNNLLYFCYGLGFRTPLSTCSTPFPDVSIDDGLLSSTLDPCNPTSIPPSTLMSNARLFILTADSLKDKLRRGNSDYIFSKIFQNPPCTPNELKQVLESCSPYLSDSALVAAINRSPVLPPNILGPILMANSRLTPKVWNALEARQPALPPVWMNSLRAAQGQISEREKLERAIDHLETMAGLALADYVRYLNELDTISGPSGDSLRQAFAADSTQPSLRMLASMLNLFEDYDAADSIVDVLDPSDEENQYFIPHQRFLIDMRRANRSFASLSAAEKQDLLQISNHDYPSAPQVRNLLFFLDGKVDATRFPLDYVPPVMREGVVPEKEKATLPTVPSTLIRAYPNPSSGMLYVEWDGPEDQGERRLQLYSSTGILKLDRYLPAKTSGRLELDLSGLPSGIYFWRVTGDSDFAGLHKLILQR